MIDDWSLQRFLADSGTYTDTVDGDWGPNSDKAVKAWARGLDLPDCASWPSARCKIAAQQGLMKSVGIDVGPIDGRVGPTFRFALESWQNRLRDQDGAADQVATQPAKWPRQKDVPAFYGEPGSNQTVLKLPYPMVLAWDLKAGVTKMSINKKLATGAGRALQKTLDHYGIDQIRALGLDRFGGCLNVRKMRGGNAMSMHSWGIAIDFDPEHNQLRWGRDRALLARAAYKPFLDFWEEEGWISLGRARNFDWMHVQAARL